MNVDQYWPSDFRLLPVVCEKKRLDFSSFRGVPSSPPWHPRLQTQLEIGFFHTILSGSHLISITNDVFNTLWKSIIKLSWRFEWIWRGTTAWRFLQEIRRAYWWYYRYSCTSRVRWFRSFQKAFLSRISNSTACATTTATATVMVTAMSSTCKRIRGTHMDLVEVRKKKTGSASKEGEDANSLSNRSDVMKENKVSTWFPDDR